ncbi:MAG: hypothetical protein JWL81_3397 [Verrucomicrobiales bacterium]|nr:hypothetical protein [Verrucomicrobiales bacterium]
MISHHESTPVARSFAPAPRHRLFKKTAVLLLAAAASTLPTKVRAFPPAPYFTVFGDARDQYGALIPPGSASVILYANSKETSRESLTNTPGRDYNYQIRVRIDMLRNSSASYSSQALATGTIYTLGIESGGLIYYPIEMATPPQIGNAADRKRLNLTLGVDSDGDGLPDAWEESQLYQGGVLPGPDGWDLTLINKLGDFDKDGINNFAEYIAGTYAADATSTLDLKITDKAEEAVSLEFYAFYGKLYQIQSSPDLKTWSDTNFTLTAAAADPPPAAQSSLTATSTGVTHVTVPAATTDSVTYYRLNIR